MTLRRTRIYRSLLDRLTTPYTRFEIIGRDADGAVDWIYAGVDPIPSEFFQLVQREATEKPRARRQLLRKLRSTPAERIELIVRESFGAMGRETAEQTAEHVLMMARRGATHTYPGKAVS